MKLDECDCKEGARPRSGGLTFSILGPCRGGKRGSLRNGLVIGDIGICHGVVGEAPGKGMEPTVSSRLWKLPLKSLTLVASPVKSPACNAE